jgi:hypothetical protein
VLNGPAPYGTAVFSLSQNGVVVSEAGIPASPPALSSRLFIDYRTGVAAGSGTLDIFTGLAIVNRNDAAAAVTYLLRNQSGQILATGHGNLPAGAHRAKFIHELKDLAPDFNLPANFPTQTLYGSLEILSSQPVSILALRLTTNQRGETLLTSTSVADLSLPVNTSAVYFPQLADGGGYTTSLVLSNLTGAVQTGIISIFDDTGAALSVRQAGGASGSTFPYSISVGGTFVFQTDGGPVSVRTGWARVTPNVGSTSPVGAGVFSYTPAGILVTESGIPSAVPTTRARIYVDKSNGHDTGLAMANPAAGPISITIQAFQTNGTTGAGNGPVTLSFPTNGHTAAFVGQLISQLPDGFQGVAELNSATPFVALTLRSLTNGRGDFLLTTFPVADTNQSAPSPIVFPQIADGAGYATEIIFVSAGGAASVDVNFIGDDGSPLNIGRR